MQAVPHVRTRLALLACLLALLAGLHVGCEGSPASNEKARPAAGLAGSAAASLDSYIKFSGVQGEVSKSHPPQPMTYSPDAGAQKIMQQNR